MHAWFRTMVNIGRALRANWSPVTATRMAALSATLPRILITCSCRTDRGPPTLSDARSADRQSVIMADWVASTPQIFTSFHEAAGGGRAVCEVWRGLGADVLWGHQGPADGAWHEAVLLTRGS